MTTITPGWFPPQSQASPRSGRTARHRLPAACGGLALLLLVGCESGPASTPAEADATADRLNHLLARSRGIDLDGVDKPDAPPPHAPVGAFPGLPDFAAAAPTAAQAADGPIVQPPAAQTMIADAPTAPPTLTDQQREQRAISELLDVLSRRAAGSDPSLAEVFRLTALASLCPGETSAALQNHLRGLEACLNTDQRARLDAFRELVAAFAATDSTEDLSAILRKHADSFVPTATLNLPTVALARRVDGYGKYVPFASTSFLAGQAQVVLVYVEVKDFLCKEVSSAAPDSMTIDDPDPSAGAETSWAIELSQELQLYHEADGVLAWHARQQPSRDLSKRRRTDHYLVQRITLPATLTVGGYTLKVVVRDVNSTALVERAIPIRIVADPALTHAAIR
jgi:hypothetical protein